MLEAPSPTSPTFRAELARLISPLKRVRPRVPFWQLAAHRIPTLALYRGLLRSAPTGDIRFRVHMLFKQNQHRTGTDTTIKYLRMGYKWLDIFNRAKQGDAHLQKVLARYSSLLAVRREKTYWKYLAHKERAWQLKMQARPIVTGFFRASLFNPHLPRLKPQPLHMTMILKKRRLTRENRYKRYINMREQLQLIQNEQALEAGLLKQVQINLNGGKNQNPMQPVFAGQREWVEPIRNALDDLFHLEARTQERAKAPIPEWLKKMVKKARAERVRNKTREAERERHGEVVTRTMRRRRSGPPAHILCKMTPEEKVLDKAARSVSEVGFAAIAKRKLGIKIKDPDAWRKEIGSTEGEEGERLKKMVQGVREENQRRRSCLAESDEGRNILIFEKNNTPSAYKEKLNKPMIIR
ncbi:hypothetical protein AMATHDRAFT_62250 [Amanita thiersii Skay4041]|uniref:Uncharacterized protein n=1 Tax=Amanita thiersii Skay4041 TaxID=703135 RepID=A0A2A9NQ27_9AGAR|nr:hypothetical protein AMATHDRAFT_62250 [Amanita thiersii Skay4041]